MVKPKRCFPVHDGVLARPDTTYRISKAIIGEAGIEFFVPEPGKETNL
jgi:hypothetical protein